MTLTPRALGVVLCLAASGCFGGPTSDWPPRAGGDSTKDEGQSPSGPPSNAGAGADAGALSIDASAPPADPGLVPCVSTPAGDGGAADAGVGDAVQPDAGCR